MCNKLLFHYSIHFSSFIMWLTDTENEKKNQKLAATANSGTHSDIYRFYMTINMWLGIMQIDWTALGKVNICHIFFSLWAISLYHLISMNRLQTANKASIETKETTTAITRKTTLSLPSFPCFYISLLFPFHLNGQVDLFLRSSTCKCSETAAPCVSVCLPHCSS